ncbi:MAG: 5-formyltetrahydrofolate cyclo-ligase [Acutalibacteraceae bacterium]
MNKSDLRNEMKSRISSLSGEYIRTAGREIENRVINSKLYKNSKTLFVYVSAKAEPPTLGIIAHALKSGKTVCVPKCCGKGIMKAVRIESLSDLSEGAFGIFEPKDCENTCGAESIDLALVPCMCASRDGRRLGHGGGYYDRFLEKNDTVKMCLCFEKLLCEDIPTNEHDVIMDYVVTEISGHSDTSSHNKDECVNSLYKFVEGE